MIHYLICNQLAFFFIWIGAAWANNFKSRASVFLGPTSSLSNAHFLSNIDNCTGYKTRSIITAPIFNSQREIQGVLELLNKDGGFDNDDVKFMVFFSHYISGFLELINKSDVLH